MKPKPGLKLGQVTHTYTAPNGAIVVIRNVPAKISTDGDGREKTSFRLDVAERLEQLLAVALARTMPNGIELLSYDEAPTVPSADYSLKFRGPGAHFEDASIYQWRLVFDKTCTAYKTAAKGINADFSANEFPTVAYLAGGSIIVGVRSSEQSRLFDISLDQEPDRAFQLLIETSRWLDNETAMPSALEQDSDVADAMLKAVEELSPTKSDSSVVLERIGEQHPTIFTRKKRERAHEERIRLRISRANELQRLELIGRIGTLDDNGVVRLREIEENSGWKYKTADCQYDGYVLPTLLESFGKRVRISALLRTTKKRSKAPPLEIIDVRQMEEPPTPDQLILHSSNDFE